MFKFVIRDLFTVQSKTTGVITSRCQDAGVNSERWVDLKVVDLSVTTL